MQPCAEPGCPELTTRTRCPAHTKQQQNTTRARYPRGRYGHEWPAISRRQLARHPNCTICGAPATEVDHITPLRAFTTRRAAHHETNLQSLCKRHHSAKTLAEIRTRTPNTTTGVG